jgi:hypothetical protein
VSTESDRLPRTTRPRQDIPFIYPSYRLLAHRLGATDGLASAITMATRHFLDHSSHRDDKQEFGLMLAKRYRISTRYIDLDTLFSHMIGLLMVATSKYMEDFFDRFRQEQQAIGRTWRNKEKGESELKMALSCISGGFVANKEKIGSERYELLEYYRTVRNSSAHSGVESRRLCADFKNVQRYRQTIENEFGLEAPNRYDALTFHDHLLYTRLVKYLATDLCRLAPPETALEFKKILVEKELFPRESNSFLLRLGHDEGLRRKLRTLFFSGYNFNLDKYPSIEEELVNWLNGLPRRKERRSKDKKPLIDELKNYINL